MCKHRIDYSMSRLAKVIKGLADMQSFYKKKKTPCPGIYDQYTAATTYYQIISSLQNVGTLNEAAARIVADRVEEFIDWYNDQADIEFDDNDQEYRKVSPGKRRISELTYYDLQYLVDLLEEMRDSDQVNHSDIRYMLDRLLPANDAPIVSFSDLKKSNDERAIEEKASFLGQPRHHMKDTIMDALDNAPGGEVKITLTTSEPIGRRPGYEPVSTTETMANMRLLSQLGAALKKPDAMQVTDCAKLRMLQLGEYGNLLDQVLGFIKQWFPEDSNAPGSIQAGELGRRITRKMGEVMESLALR